MLRDSSNCSVTRALPSEDDDVISVTPEMRPSARSSGVATVAAITSGLAPGSDAETDTTGKSTCGSGETGRSWKATIPASATPMVSSVVATGRLTNGWVMLAMGGLAVSRRPACAPLLRPQRCAVEVEVDDRRGEDGEQLRED